MDDSETPELDRLMALAEEAEQILAKSIGSHDLRHACALARGYLDLALFYHEPVKVEDVERVLVRMRALIAPAKLPRIIEPRIPPVRLSSR